MAWRGVGRVGIRFIEHNKLSTAILVAVILGFAIGMTLNFTIVHSDRNLMFVGFIGSLYVQILLGISLPLTVSCIIKTFATSNTLLIKTFGLQLTSFVIVTKLIAVITATITTVVIRPGKQNSSMSDTNEHIHEIRILFDGLLDMIRNLFPDNLIDTAMKQSCTSIKINGNTSMREADFVLITKDGVNMLGLINFSLFFGLALKAMGSDNKPLLDLVATMRRITFEIVKLIMYATPVFILSMFAEETVRIMDVSSFPKGLRNYLACVTFTLLVQLFVVYPTIFVLMTKRNPFLLYWYYFQAIITAFATSSSLASVPIAIGTLENFGGYDESLVSLVVPIGIAFNKDGACIFYACATIFFAQLANIYLDFGSYMLIAFLSMITSIFTPGITHGAYYLLYMILEFMDIPTTQIGISLSLNYIVDRIVTVVNITGNALAVAVISHYNSKIQVDDTEDTEETPEQES